jgi:hypothetical protein
MRAVCTTGTDGHLEPMTARSTPTALRRAAVLLLASFVAAGCGDDGDAPAKQAETKPDEPRAITAPSADEDLSDALGDSGDALVDAGCSFGTLELGDPDHVSEDEDLDSPSFPPSSGRHYEDWAPFGLYDEPVPDGNLVHNLEHGGVVAWLGTDVDDATGEAIADLLDDGEKWIVAPREDIPGLYSAAWGLGLSCPPAALEKLGAEQAAELLDAWFEVVESTGSPAEKDVPAYAGAMKEPTPVRDISAETPEF